MSWEALSAPCLTLPYLKHYRAMPAGLTACDGPFVTCRP